MARRQTWLRFWQPHGRRRGQSWLSFRNQGDLPRQKNLVAASEWRLRSPKVGHWARDGKGKGLELGASYVVDSSSSAPEVGVSYLESEEQQLHYVASVTAESALCMAVEHGVMLLSSPGYGVLDSGCCWRSDFGKVSTTLDQKGNPLAKAQEGSECLQVWEWTSRSVWDQPGHAGRDWWLQGHHLCSGGAGRCSTFDLSACIKDTPGQSELWGRFFDIDLWQAGSAGASAGQYSVDVLDFPSPIKPELFTDVPTSGAQVPVAKEDNPQSQGSDLNNSIGPHLQPLNKSVGPDSPTLNNDNATSSRSTGHEVMSASRKVGKPEVSPRNNCVLPKHRSRRDGVNWVRSIW